MQKVEITGGYVELKDFVTRKMSRVYMDKLSEHSVTKEDGSLAITATAINIASEYIVLQMITRAVVKGEDGVEKEVEADEEWLDALREKDFNLISEAVLKLFNEGRKTAKKA